MNQGGFPHSEIPGSKLVCSLPGLIAAYRVLHRLLAPRHSPYALSSLTIRNSNLRWPGFGIRDSGFEEPLLESPIPNPKSQPALVSCTLRVHLRPPSHLAMRRRAPADECVVGKNYRLQDIQLSKITPGEMSPRGIFRWSRGAFPRTPFARSLAGPRCPAPFARVVKDLVTVSATRRAGEFTN